MTERLRLKADDGGAGGVQATRDDQNHHAPQILATTDAEVLAPDLAPASIDARAEIIRLAGLDLITYDQNRRAVAEALGIRPATLDASVRKAREQRAVAEMSGMFPVIEPWPYPVNGAALLSDIEETIRRFIVSEPETRTAATLWIAFSWFIEAVQVAPLAVITAPEKHCGKTQLLDLIGRLSRRPLIASNISSAAVFRVIEAHQPTLLIDEADAFMRENEELRGVINSGHTRSSAYVIRTVGDDHETKQFSTWGAKVLCGIGTLPETLMDRAVVLELRRKLPTESVGRLRHAEPGLFSDLARKLARFAGDSEHRMRSARPALPEALNDRVQDNWEPLLAIADLAGGGWPDLARRAALKISSEEAAALSTGAELLADVRTAFDQDSSDRLATMTLIDRLIADDLAPWATFNRGKPISPHQLAKRLGEYDIRPRKMRMGIGGSPLQGFDRSQFEDAWSRYLETPLSPVPPFLSGTPEQVNKNKDLGVPDANNCSGTRHLSGTSNLLKKNDCSDVPDKNPQEVGEAWEATI